MAGAPDPWVELSRLAPHGLDSAEIVVFMKGEPVTITAADIELAIKQSATSTRIEMPQGTDTTAVAAALNVVLIDPDEEIEVFQNAQAGDEKAAALYQAIQFRRVVTMRGAARKLLAAYRAKNPRAVNLVRRIQGQAVGKGPERGRARIVLWLLTKDARPRRIEDPGACGTEALIDQAPEEEATTHGESSGPVPDHLSGCAVYAGIMRCVVGCPAHGKTKPEPKPSTPTEPQFTGELDGQAVRH